MEQTEEERSKAYEVQPRKSLMDYWIKLGGELWDKHKESEHPRYPKGCYSKWYAVATQYNYYKLINKQDEEERCNRV